METETCAICQQPIADDDPAVRLGVKGCAGIVEAKNLVNGNIEIKPGDIVHVDCRKTFTRPRNCNDNNIVGTSDDLLRSLRSKHEQFEFKSKCLFCGSLAKYCASSRKRSHDVYPVRTLDFQTSIQTQCIDRNDTWSNEVNARLSQVIDLPAAEAVYHQACSVNFRTKKNVPKAFRPSDQGATGEVKSPGRPAVSNQAQAFKTIIEVIESGGNTSLTMNDLVQKMKDICGDQSYSKKHMKRKIIEHFRESVVVSSIDGKNDILTLKQSVSSIVHRFYEGSKERSDEENKQNIIKTAACLIKNDINRINSSRESYPVFTDVSSVEKNMEFLPAGLRLFLTELFSDKTQVKTASIGQCMIQACRPKGLLPPLQLGLQLHHHFGSRFLVDTLNSLGFCCSYWEVQKYESNAAAILSTRIPCQKTNAPFLQFIADNVDHNVRTLDGQGTFHGMGIIATSTPGFDIPVVVPRKDISMDEVATLARIDIKYYAQPQLTSEDVLFKELPPMQPSNQCEPLDMFFKLVWPVRQCRPSWSGFMQSFEQAPDRYPSKSAITFMPMIDLNPSDCSCIFSTLHFVCEQVARYNTTPVLTFDQPLYQKAMDIVSSQEASSPLKSMVLRLGGFHTQMSFLGCIGHLTSGSGLQEVVETVYAPNAVTHMMSGKAIQRAIRGHMLVDNALTVLLLENGSTDALEPESTLTDDNIQQDIPEQLLHDQDLNNLSTAYDNLEKDKSNLKTLVHSLWN